MATSSSLSINKLDNLYLDNSLRIAHPVTPPPITKTSTFLLFSLLSFIEGVLVGISFNPLTVILLTICVNNLDLLAINPISTFFKYSFTSPVK